MESGGDGVVVGVGCAINLVGARTGVRARNVWFIHHAASFGPLLLVRLSGKRVQRCDRGGHLVRVHRAPVHLLPDAPGDFLERVMPFASLCVHQASPLTSGERADTDIEPRAPVVPGIARPGADLSDAWLRETKPKCKKATHQTAKKTASRKVTIAPESDAARIIAAIKRIHEAKRFTYGNVADA